MNPTFKPLKSRGPSTFPFRNSDHERDHERYFHTHSLESSSCGWHAPERMTISSTGGELHVQTLLEPTLRTEVELVSLCHTRKTSWPVTGSRCRCFLFFVQHYIYILYAPKSLTLHIALKQCHVGMLNYTTCLLAASGRHLTYILLWAVDVQDYKYACPADPISNPGLSGK